MLPLLLASALADDVHPTRTETPIGRGERVVAVARAQLDEPYRWEGRGTARLPGWDCLGILFHAAGTIDGRSWRAYEVNPSELVANGKLGRAVPGLDGVLAADADTSALRPGDVVYLLRAGYAIPDAPLWTHDGQDYWPWHTALATGPGRVLHAAPGGSVREQPLEELLWDALFVTRSADPAG